MGGKSKTKSEATSSQATTLNPQGQGLSDSILASANSNATSPAAVAQSAAAQGVVNTGISDLQKTAAGQYLDGTQNPTLQHLVASQQDAVKQQLQQNINTIGDVSQQQGAYGGSRQGVTEGVAQAQYAKDALNSANNIYYGNYNAERQNQLNAGNTLQSYLTAGDQATNGNNESLARILAILGGYNSTTSGTTTGTQTTAANPVSQAIALAAAFAPH